MKNKKYIKANNKNNEKTITERKHTFIFFIPIKSNKQKQNKKSLRTST